MAEPQTQTEAKKTDAKKAPAAKAKSASSGRDELKGKHILIKTNCKGVYMGIWDGYKTQPVEGQKHPKHVITLLEARRVWELGNQSLDDLADRGPAKGSTVKVMDELEKVELEDKLFANERSYQVLELTEKAVAAFAKAEPYEHP